MLQFLYTPRSDDEEHEKSNTWMNTVVESDEEDSIDEWSDDDDELDDEELDEEYIAEDG